MSNNTHNNTASLLLSQNQLPKTNSSTTTTTSAHHLQHQQQRNRRISQQQQPLPSSSSSSNENRNNNDINTTNTNTSSSSSGFSSMEIEELKQSFDLFDVEGTGKVPIQTVINVLRDLQEIETASGVQQQQQRSIYPNLQQLIDILSSTIVAENNNKSNVNGNTGDGEEEEVVVIEFHDYLRLMEMTTINYKLSSSSGFSSRGNVDGGGDDDDNINKLVYVFDLFDIDSKGYITLDDLERIAFELGESTMTRDELADMIDRASALVGNHNNNNSNNTTNNGRGAAAAAEEGRVTLEAFIKMMTYDLFPKKQQQHDDDEEEGYGVDEGIVVGQNEKQRRNSSTKAEF